MAKSRCTGALIATALSILKYSLRRHLRNEERCMTQRKTTSLTVVYHDPSYGYMIVPYAVEQNMGCRIAIDPTITLLPGTSDEELGATIKKGIKIAANASEVDIEKDNLNEFWKKTKYKGFCSFSNHFQSVNVTQYENQLRIEKWIATPRKGYVKDDSQKTIEISAMLTNIELGRIIRKFVNCKTEND